MSSGIFATLHKIGIRDKIRHFGDFISGMVLPNIGAFIGWGIITMLFIPSGWIPNENVAKLVSPMITYLIPLLIGYTGGNMIGGTRGGVVGALATIGVITSAQIPMILGAMIVGPLGGYVIKNFDRLLQGKIKPGFEMLVNNFSAGILGSGLTLLGYLVIGPLVLNINSVLKTGVEAIVNSGFLPLTSIFIEPAKVLFLNGAIAHGVLSPLGIQQTQEVGKSIFFLIESNPGPGLGILLAFWAFSKSSAKLTAPGAVLIHFFGGIHEIYFPYVLMKPALLIAVILGGMSGVFTFEALDAGLVAIPVPGSIFVLLAMTPKGGYIATLGGFLVATIVSFTIAAIIFKTSKENSKTGLKNT